MIERERAELISEITKRAAVEYVSLGADVAAFQKVVDHAARAALDVVLRRSTIAAAERAVCEASLKFQALKDKAIPGDPREESVGWETIEAQERALAEATHRLRDLCERDVLDRCGDQRFFSVRNTERSAFSPIVKGHVAVLCDLARGHDGECSAELGRWSWGPT